MFAPMLQDALSRLARAWPVVAVVDGLFATALSILAYDSTATRLWQSVASTLLGPAAFEGGARTVLVGLVMHAGVALLWSAMFVALYVLSPRLQRLAATPAGMLAVAAAYGPLVWIVMSFVVVPALTGRPPTIGVRWWVQLAGHVVFVALPIVVMTARVGPTPRPATRPAATAA